MRSLFFTLSCLVLLGLHTSAGACTYAAPLDALNAQLASARALAIQEEYERAQTVLRDLEGRLLCTEAPLSATTLARLSYITAYVQWALDDEALARTLLEQAFRLNLDLEWDNGLGDAEEIQSFLSLYTQVRMTTLRYIEPARLYVETAGADGFLYVDGKAFPRDKTARAPTAQALLPGRHLVQRQARDLRFVGVWLELPVAGELHVNDAAFPRSSPISAPGETAALNPQKGADSVSVGLMLVHLEPIGSQQVTNTTMLGLGLQLAARRPLTSTLGLRADLGIAPQVVANEGWKRMLPMDANEIPSTSSNGQMLADFDAWQNEHMNLQVMGSVGLEGRWRMRYLELNIGWMVQGGISTAGAILYEPETDAESSGTIGRLAAGAWGTVLTGPALGLKVLLPQQAEEGLEVRFQPLSGVGQLLPSGQGEGAERVNLDLSDRYQLGITLAFLFSKAW